MDKKLTDLQAAVDSLAKQNIDLTSQLTTLKRDVGFSASLAAANQAEVLIGPGATETIKFKNVFINNGGAYDPVTGVFNAPLKGAYQFTFTTWGYAAYFSGARLMKNGHLQVSTWQTKGQNGSTSGAVVLSLEAGDKVTVTTWGDDQDGRSFQVYDGRDYRLTTFSGFLLFPLYSVL